jgi:hypothetical protein
VSDEEVGEDSLFISQGPRFFSRLLIMLVSDERLHPYLTNNEERETRI